MFDLPEAKRVRRDELLSRPSASPSPSPPPESNYEDVHQRLGALLNIDSFITQEQPEGTQNATETQPQEDEEEEFEFRLFSAPAAPKQSETGDKDKTAGTGDSKAASAGTQKLRIRVRSPTPGPAGLGEGGFLKPFRGWQYYFTSEALYSGSGAAAQDSDDEETKLRRAQFENVAVSGQDMMNWAQQPWPGCHLPWRVIRLKRQHTKLPPDEKGAVVYKIDPPVKISPKTRKKPGKKRRVQLRKRLTAADDAKEKEAEKRNRKNRERKLKRRQKAREQKAAAAAAAGEPIPAGDTDGEASSQEGDD